MMDHDIVDQLRSKYQGQLSICTQAADEIERLRTELHMAEKWRDNYKLAFERCQGTSVRSE